MTKMDLNKTSSSENIFILSTTMCWNKHEWSSKSYV